MKYKMLTLQGEDLPQSLSELHQPVEKLHVIGENLSNILERPKVAIVGTRKPTQYGTFVAQQLASELAAAGITIISGLALGIDGIAHRAAISANGTTIAVLPTSLERIYPRTHTQLAHKILETGGCLISEYPTGTAPMKHQFIARNRIIAALCDAVLIPEAALKSGSLHTANFALELGKPVLAVPGQINNIQSEGCNNLIKQGAALVSSGDDVLFALGYTRKGITSSYIARSPEEEKLIAALKQGISSVNELHLTTSIPVADCSYHLTMLELNGAIRSMGGGEWALI